MSDFETLIQSRLLKLHLTVLTGVRIYTTSNHHPLTIDIHCTKLSLKMVCFHNFEYFRSHSTVGRRCFGSTKMCPHPRSQGTPKTSICFKNSEDGWCCNFDSYLSFTTFFIPHHVFFPNGLARHVFFWIWGTMMIIFKDKCSTSRCSTQSLWLRSPWWTPEGFMHHLVGWVGVEKFMTYWREKNGTNMYSNKCKT